MIKLNKALLRVPTSEQYAFIEVEVESENAEEIVEAYKEITQMVKPKTGLTDKEFNSALDKYLSSSDDESLSSEEYANMNEKQKDIIQAVKRSLKRLVAKDLRDNPEL